MSKQSLLLVDGDPRSLRVLEVSLRKAGFSVTTAESARAAQEKIVVGAPDLIISEIKLDDGDGFELCRRVRSTPEWQDSPFMFLTGEVGIENKIRGLELGVDEYLTKPIYIKEIVTRIHMLLQKRPRDRIGYAEDVAAELARLERLELARPERPERLGQRALPGPAAATGSSPELRLRDGGPSERPRAYVYRPGLAGRAELLDVLEDLLELPAAPEGEEIVFDYATLGLTLRRHPLALLRPLLAKRGFMPAEELWKERDGRQVHYCGIVTVRQQPSTANGTIFLSLEDESGTVQVIAWKSLREEQRVVLLNAKLLAVRGRWQREGDVRNLIAAELEDLTPMLGRLARTASSRDFH